MTKAEAQRLMLKHGITVNDLVAAGVAMTREALNKRLMGSVAGREGQRLIPHTLEVYLLRFASGRE